MGPSRAVNLQPALFMVQTHSPGQGEGLEKRASEGTGSSGESFSRTVPAARQPVPPPGWTRPVLPAALAPSPGLPAGPRSGDRPDSRSGRSASASSPADASLLQQLGHDFPVGHQIHQADPAYRTYPLKHGPAERVNPVGHDHGRPGQGRFQGGRPRLGQRGVGRRKERDRHSPAGFLWDRDRDTRPWTCPPPAPGHSSPPGEAAAPRL